MKEKIVREEYSFILVDDVKAVVEKLVTHTYKQCVDSTDGEIYILYKKNNHTKTKVYWRDRDKRIKTKKACQFNYKRDKTDY